MLNLYSSCRGEPMCSPGRGYARQAGQTRRFAPTLFSGSRIGFSIIEIIVVIVVIGIMLAVALPKYSRVVEKSRQSEAFTNLAAIRASQARYHAEKGEWAQDDADSDAFDELDFEEPADAEQYFDYYTSDPQYSPNENAIAWGIRRANIKNCCFGEYMIFISTAGKITKESADGYDSVP